jgi:hypothetical protein
MIGFACCDLGVQGIDAACRYTHEYLARASDGTEEVGQDKGRSNASRTTACMVFGPLMLFRSMYWERLDRHLFVVPMNSVYEQPAP